MQNLIRGGLFFIFTFMLTGCLIAEKEQASTNTKITIEPYSLSEKESLLISKTGVGSIEFFKLNGILKEEDDLQFAVEVYENGKLKEKVLSTSNEPKKKYKDEIISFGTSNIEDENRSVKLLAGIPNGLVTANYPNEMTFVSYGKLIGKKITLVKDKPVYLTVWAGTTKTSLRSFGSENGELPEGMEEAELTLLFKVVWTSK